MIHKIFLSVLMVLASFNLQSQSLYNVGSTLYVGSNTVLSVSDSIVNDGTITNNGDIQVAGIWQNNSTYNPGQGQLTLTSSQPQVINHNDQSFTRLAISGGGQKIFGADITIVGELIMNDGILVSSGNSKLIIADGAVITGGSDNSYIDGPLYHLGTGYKYYPIGSGSVFLPVELLDVKGVNPTLGVLLTLPNPNLSVQGNLLEVTGQQYWQLDILQGSFDGSQVVLPLKDELFLDIIDQAVVAQAAAVDSPFLSLGASQNSGNALVGTVTSDLDATDLFLTIGKIEAVAEFGSEIIVYNAVSPNDDGMNDILKISNITLFPNNIVTIYTRWGDKVFEITGYDNAANKFDGNSNVGKIYLLPEGTYYYVIEKGDGSDNVSGYFVLRN